MTTDPDFLPSDDAEDLEERDRALLSAAAAGDPSVRTRRIGANWALRSLARRHGIEEDLCTVFGEEDGRRLLLLAVGKFCLGQDSLLAVGKWTREFGLPGDTALKTLELGELLQGVTEEKFQDYFRLRRRRHGEEQTPSPRFVFEVTYPHSLAADSDTYVFHGYNNDSSYRHLIVLSGKFELLGMTDSFYQCDYRSDKKKSREIFRRLLEQTDSCPDRTLLVSESSTDDYLDEPGLSKGGDKFHYCRVKHFSRHEPNQNWTFRGVNQRKLRAPENRPPGLDINALVENDDSCVRFHFRDLVTGIGVQQATMDLARNLCKGRTEGWLPDYAHSPDRILRYWSSGYQRYWEINPKHVRLSSEYRATVSVVTNLTREPAPVWAVARRHRFMVREFGRLLDKSGLTDGIRYDWLDRFRDTRTGVVLVRAIAFSLGLHLLDETMEDHGSEAFLDLPLTMTLESLNDITTHRRERSKRWVTADPDHVARGLLERLHVDNPPRIFIA